MQQILCKHDIVSLLELKHAYPMSLPGYTFVRSRIIEGEQSRGGVGVFFRNSIWSDVCDLECARDQVWFRLHSLPQIIFGLMYIPPRDSTYYNPQAIASIQEHRKQAENMVLLGDLNARIGPLDRFNRLHENIMYTVNPDPVTNANGRDVISLCTNNDLVPVNHLHTDTIKCDGGLTYRQGRRGYPNLTGLCVHSV